MYIMRYSIEPGDRICKILQNYTEFYAPTVTLSEVVCIWIIWLIQGSEEISCVVIWKWYRQKKAHSILPSKSLNF